MVRGISSGGYELTDGKDKAVNEKKEDAKGMDVFHASFLSRRKNRVEIYTVHAVMLQLNLTAYLTWRLH